MKFLILSAVTAMAITTTLGADELSDLKTQLKILSDRLSTLEANEKKQVEQTDALTSELINVQNQTSFTAVDASKAIQGLGAAASKVYYSKNPLSIGGYGELYYSKHNDSVGTGSTKDNYGDTYRFIPYIGYKFTDNIILNSEIEFEHGNEVWIEQLYVDFILDKMATVRVGDQIVPMGYTNLYHEPTLFNTVQRPDVEKQLIPSTWHELGVSVYGQTDNFWYQIGAFTALDFNHPTNGTSGSTGTYGTNEVAASNGANWIRKARVGAESDKGIDNIAIVARLDYNGINGLQIGVSGYTGKAGNVKVPGQTEEGRMTMYDIHAVYQNEGFKARALYTESRLSNAGSYDTNMSEGARGGYVNLEYNIMPFFAQTTDRLPIFFQYENYNLATKTANGKSFGTTESFTTGLNYFPHDQVVLKAEYMLRHNKNYINTTKYINEGIYSLGLGFIF
ncbi:MAG: porin [Sulfuricurvum sp.]|nr:porin [Sulfuricurvum sp.]MDP3023033.1 porin [Sulfuricurvum sp.]